MIRKRAGTGALLREMYRSHVPPSVRIPLRRLRRRFREYRIKGFREELLKTSYPPNTRKLIIILTPGWDGVSGGILSETALYEETCKLKGIHDSETLMCTIPGESALLKYTLFENQNYLYDFQGALSYFENLKSLLIHIPEYTVGKFLLRLTKRDYSRLAAIGSLHFNILLQNLEQFYKYTTREDLDRLKSLGRLTCTAAHERYSNRQLRDELGVPLHRLSVHLTPELYERRKYNDKENLIVVSPDPHPNRREILELLADQLPQLTIHVVHDLAYREFKSLVSRAKWTLTFGEGLDGYFIETVFSGGVSFAVYNPTFFTEDFRSLKTVYENYNELRKKICTDLKRLDNERTFRAYQNKQFDLCRKYYSHEAYVQNLRVFYRGEYTFE